MTNKELRGKLKNVIMNTLKKGIKKLFKIAALALAESLIIKIIKKSKDINRRNNTNEDVLDFRVVEEF